MEAPEGADLAVAAASAAALTVADLAVDITITTGRIFTDLITTVVGDAADIMAAEGALADF